MDRTIDNESGWPAFAAEVLKERKHSLLLLTGDLGAGKTSFTKALLRVLESQDDISSPTYSIVNEYATPFGKVSHFDLYRLKSPQEVYDTGIEDYLDNSFLCIVEWPQIYMDEFSYYQYHTLHIEKFDGGRIASFN